MWKVIKEAIIKLFGLIIGAIDMADDLVASGKNATTALRKESEKLIPTDEQFQQGLEIALKERNQRIAEQEADLEKQLEKFNKSRNQNK